MGIAIINSQANYTLQRIAQNVIPVDERKRVYLTEVTNFTYEYAGDGIYRLKSLNIGDATLPYTYSLVLGVNLSGVEIDPISGVVTVSSNFTGGNLKVLLSAIYSKYYPLSNGATAFTTTTNITDVQVPSVEPATTNNHLTITGFTYSGNSISASGGNSGAPTLNYSYTKIVNGQETTVSNTDGNVEYTMHAISDSGATVNSTSGVVTVPSNSAQFVKSYIVLAKVTVDDTYQTEVAKVTQAAAVVPTEVTYTYEFSNVNLSYSGTPVAATGNSTGLTPTLTYTLTKTGSDNSSESISASSIVYSVQGTEPTGVILDTSSGKVTFAENGTDNLVLVTIKATLTAPDGTEATPTATLTQNTRTLTGISFKSYNGSNTINVTPGTTINNTDIYVNLIYNVGANGTATSTKLSMGSNGTKLNSLTFDTAGTYPLTIWYNDTFTDSSQSVVVATSTTKAYISGIPLQSAEGATDGPYPSPTTGTHQWPLHVSVTRANGTVEEKTFTEYLALNEPKETYSSPVLTFADTITYDTMATVDSNGTLTYDFTLDNYVYDGEKTKINSIQIPCTSDQSKSASYTGDGVRLNVEVQDSSYFTENFDAVPLSTSNVLLSVLNNAYHIEAESTLLLKKIVLDTNGTVYKLKPAAEYYFAVTVNGANNKKDGFGGIISLTPNTSTLTAGQYNRPNTNLVIVSNTNRTIYVHHTPIIESGKTYENYVTYFVDGYPNSNDTYLNIEVLIPKNNN